MNKSTSQCAYNVLVKLAEKNKQKSLKDYVSVDALPSVLGGQLVGGAAAIPFAAANIGSLKAMSDMVETPYTRDEAKSLARKLLRISGVPGAEKIPVYSSGLGKLDGMGPHMMPEAGRMSKAWRKKMYQMAKDMGEGTKYVKEHGLPHIRGEQYVHVGGDAKQLMPGITLPAGKHPFIVAHEVGHATPKGRLGRALVKLRTSRALSLAPTALLLGGALTTSKDDAEVSKAVKAAPWVAGAGALATQAEELRASLRGAQLLRKAKHAPIKNLRKIIAAQQGNYLGAGLAGIAPILGGAYMVKKWHKAEREGKPMFSWLDKKKK